MCIDNNHCKLSRVLDKTDTELIKRLLRMLEKEPPKHALLAEIGEVRCQGSQNCDYKYSWGYKNYCNNPKQIKKFKEQISDYFEIVKQD